METLQQIRELFQDATMRAQLEKAKSKEESLGIVATAGAARKIDFSADSLRRLIDVFASPARKPPTPAELKDVSGQMRADTHVHMSCCTDCPSSGALCC